MIQKESLHRRTEKAILVEHLQMQNVDARFQTAGINLQQEIHLADRINRHHGFVCGLIEPVLIAGYLVLRYSCVHSTQA
ncbi:MAG: hypothetical protein GX841_02040 [Bacteroidales bacterium]|nr:hypothetical protein [Bacteroidales bacterium]